MQKLYGEYDPQSANCRFEVILYNRVPPNHVGNFPKPLNVRPQLWDQFVANNPDKANLAPTAMRGYNELDVRSKQCLGGHTKIINHYGQIAERVDALKVDIEKRIKDQIAELKQVQIDLSYRLLVVVRAYILFSLKSQREQQGQVMVPPLTVNERTMRDTLQGMANATRELQVLHWIFVAFSLSMIHMTSLCLTQYKMAHADRLMAEAGAGTGLAVTGGRSTVDEEEVFDEKCMNAMFNCLSDDTKIISYLAKTVQKDYEDLEVMRNGLVPEKRLIL